MRNVLSPFSIDTIPLTGKADRQNNVLKGAPHTHAALTSDSWNKPYSREKAAYPLPYLRTEKVWFISPSQLLSLQVVD